MILDELVVHDFGPYPERQKIVLAPPSPDKPIVLFGGLNGHGKTTLLDAIQLCLYGPFANVSNRNGLSYQDYLTRCFHRGTKAREASVEIAFNHTLDGAENRYRIRRSWSAGKNGCKEHLDVLNNGRLDNVAAENWISQVEEFIPPNISSLFFFDGEQVESYATQDKSAILIGTAIRNLLGMDIVDQLDKDLLMFARRKRSQTPDDHMREEIINAESHLNNLREKQSGLRQERAALMATGLDQARKQLRRVENEYRLLGGELYDQRVEIEQEKSVTEREFDEISGQLIELASNDLPLLLVRDLLEAVQNQDQEEETVRLDQHLSGTLEKRDLELLEKMNEFKVSAKAIDRLEKHLNRDREVRTGRKENSSVLNLDPDTRADLHLLLRDGFETLSKDLSETLQRFEDAEIRLENACRKISNIPMDAVIGEVAERRESLKDRIMSLESQISDIDETLSRTVIEIERKEATLARLVESDIREAGERKDCARILSHSKRIRSTLERFRKTVIESNVDKIGYLVLESYQQLLRKKCLITGLEINPETFALTLYGHDGLELTSDRLSAGERQLLATALLWGLARASGRALPTAIDTPLGRLDASHRRFLVERYFPYASHQVLLFSTDEEISGSYLDRLAPHVGHHYCLNHDDETSGTRIEMGYFKEMEAA